jgi:hypothetical protein
MTKTFLFVILLSVFFSGDLFSQNLNNRTSFTLKNGFEAKSLQDDSAEVSNGKYKVQKVNLGGLFLAPNLGIAYPLGTFASNSGVGFIWGAKLEFAFSKLYPFVPGLVFESHSYPGAAGFISNNLLTSFSTDVVYYGASIDIILNKFIRSDFTTPVLNGEIKYASVSRTVSPDVPLEGIQVNESLLTFSGGLTFTLYIFDIGVKYTYADVYSNLDLQLKVHFPLIKF